MKTSFVVPNVVASLILGAFLAWAPSYGDMVAGNGPGTFTGIRSHHAAGKVSLTKDRTGQAVLTMTGINVDLWNHKTGFHLNASSGRDHR